MALSIQSPEIAAWANGLPVMLSHVAVAVVLLAAAAALYAFLTPHQEIRLIREGNAAAAVSFGGVLIGLALPLAFALAASASILGLALWGTSALVIQLVLFWLADLALRGLPQRVKEGDIGAAAVLVAAKLAAAAIVAAAAAAG
jgi:putative membrane protein